MMKRTSWTTSPTRKLRPTSIQALSFLRTRIKGCATRSTCGEPQRPGWGFTDNSVLPLLCCGYLMQALDKGTLGSASIMGWQADVGAVGQDYALTTTLLYIGITLGEPIVSGTRWMEYRPAEQPDYSTVSSGQDPWISDDDLDYCASSVTEPS